MPRASILALAANGCAPLRDALSPYLGYGGGTTRPDCGGRGRGARRDVVTVRIPPGIEGDIALRIPGRGLPGPALDDVPGDAYVVVHTAADPRFSRSGADLWRREVVTVPDAVLGITRTIPTLDAQPEARPVAAALSCTCHARPRPGHARATQPPAPSPGPSWMSVAAACLRVRGGRHHENLQGRYEAR
ncbi:DnaJ C-terminal domain-containing protein [Streptomyces sp. NPDC050121]|uniref:DnaJ C-terminal domain-containing protein n=1 Tax=Streptomyces sp. NPDC050121 TaxID=3365601 RepID=UPI0037A93F45